MRLASAGVLLAAILGASPLGAASPSTSAQDFQVVVHAGVRGTWISKATLSSLFTRHADRWGDRAWAKPVDQSAKSPVRHAFTTWVLGRSMGEIQQYWQKRVATDRVFPPPVVASDDEVLRYVANTAGAVGYVAANATIPEGVKVIAVTD